MREVGFEQGLLDLCSVAACQGLRFLSYWRNRAAWLVSSHTLGIRFWKQKEILISNYRFLSGERIVLERERKHVVLVRGPHAFHASHVLHLVGKWNIRAQMRLLVSPWGRYTSSWLTFCNIGFHFESWRSRKKQLSLLQPLPRLQSQPLKN